VDADERSEDERSEDERSEDELTDYQLRKVLHEPVAPHLTHVYTTLTHLVQGLVLAAIFYVISIQGIPIFG